MKVINILNGRCLVVELPEGALLPEIDDGNLYYYVHKHDVTMTIPLPLGNWRIIGMLSEVTEEQAAEIVDGDRIPFDETQGAYRDYTYKSNWGAAWLSSALESLESSILAEGWYFENPHGEEPTHLEHMRAGWLDNPITDDVRRVWNWKEAQSRVLCRERCLLLGREDV